MLKLNTMPMPELPANIDFSNPSFLYVLALALIEQKNRKSFIIEDQEFSREQCLAKLFEYRETYLPGLKINHPLELDNLETLNKFIKGITETIGKTVPKASGPTAGQLEVLVNEYEAHLQKLAQEETLRESRTLKLPSLKEQLERAQQYHNERRRLIEEEEIKKVESRELAALRNQAIQDINERLAQKIAWQSRAQPPAARIINEEFLRKAFDEAIQESVEADVAFSRQEKEALAALLQTKVDRGAVNIQTLTDGYFAQETLIRTSPPPRKAVIEKIEELAFLKPSEAIRVLDVAETLRLSAEEPTELAIRGALRKTGVSGISIEKLAPHIQHYLLAHPVSQPQGQPFLSSLSKALKISRRLNLSPVVIQNALNGLKAAPALEKALSETHGLRFFRWRLAWAQKKAKALNFVDKNNPLRPIFGQIFFPDLKNKNQARARYYQTAGQYLQKQRPGSFLERLILWRSRASMFSRQRWNGLLSRSQRLRSFVGFLPKLRPSYFIGRKLGGYLVRKSAAWALKGGARVFGGKVLGFIGSKLLGKAAGSLIGGVVGGPVGLAVGAALSAVLNKERLKKLLAIAAGAAAAFLGFLFGLITKLGSLVLIGGGLALTAIGIMTANPLLVGLGLTSTAAGGLKSLFGGGAAAQAASGVNTLLSAPAAATVSAPVAAAPIIAVGATAILTATTIITKGGAFLPKPEELGEVGPYHQSKYFQIEKTATPAKFSTDQLEAIWNSEQLASVTYEIKITSKEKDITVTKIDDQFSIYPRGVKVPSTPTIGVSLPVQISAGESISYKYQLTFDRQYLDSLVSNIMIVTADVNGGPSNEQSSDRAGVIFGKAPTLCFEFNGSWTEEEEFIELQAMGHLSQWPHFSSLLCSHGPITLTRGKEEDFGGYAKSINEILVYDKGLGSFYSTLYTLSHESGHLIDYRNDQLRARDFRKSGAPAVEGFLPTYPEEKSEAEDFAETIALYVVWDKMSFKCCGKINYPVEFPRHYNFAKDFIFSP